MKKLVMDPHNRLASPSLIIDKEEEVKCLKCHRDIKGEGWIAFNPCITELTLCQDCHDNHPWFMYFCAQHNHPRFIYEFEISKFNIKMLEQEEKRAEEEDEFGDLFITTMLVR